MIISALKKNSFFYSYLNNSINFKHSKNENVQPWTKFHQCPSMFVSANLTFWSRQHHMFSQWHKKSPVSMNHLSSLVRKCAESCKELHISFHPIFLHLLRDGSDWTTTRAISKVSWCHQDSYWLCEKPPWFPICRSTCFNYSVSMYLNSGKQKKKQREGGKKWSVFYSERRRHQEDVTGQHVGSGWSEEEEEER